MTTKRKACLLAIPLLFLILLCCGIILSPSEPDNVIYQSLDAGSERAAQRNTPQLAETSIFTSTNTSQPGLICYVEGTFSWTPGETVCCRHAQGGISELPDGWTFLREDIKIRRGVFGWKEGATYECTVKTLAGVSKTYTVSIYVTKDGTPLTSFS